MIIAFICILIALGAAAGLGYQVGFRRGVILGVARAEEDLVVTAITRSIRDGSRASLEIPRRYTK
jgi:hypothetical protein